MEAPIKDVSDTARWMAVYRAQETERRQPIFRDPYARLLAGARGSALARQSTGGRRTAWPVVVRTAVLDELLLSSLATGQIGCVLNLGAGLDTRPYRLALPAHLRWIEVDQPEILDYKARLLAGESTRCQLERISIDLSDPAARWELLDRVDAEGRDTLVVAEGVLIYLATQDVADLSRELAARSSFKQWLLNVSSPAVLGGFYRQRMQKDFEAGNAAWRFAPAEGPDFFRAQGWKPAVVRSAWDEARRFGRAPWWMEVLWRVTPPERRQMYRETAQYVVLVRDERQP